MITQVLRYIAAEVNNSLDNPATPSVEEFVVLGNIAKLESASGISGTDLASKVILTLVNIEEEKSLKNNPAVIRQGEDILKRNPTVFLNLYLLFSCADDDYATALDKISEVIAFLQHKYVFTPENAAVTNFPIDRTEKIILDLFTMNFEQINHLWGILGGKYIPSVLYKMRLLPVQFNATTPVSKVEEFKLNSEVTN